MKAEDFKFFTELGVNAASDLCTIEVLSGARLECFECMASTILCSPTGDWVGFRTADELIHVVRPPYVAHLSFGKPK